MTSGTQEATPIRVRPVVTCFITRRHPHGPEFLLLRRSNQVHTYKNHWAGISGSIENGENPTFSAHRELYEETQLRPPLLELVRPGPTLTFSVEDLSTQWKVHPFLFALSAGSVEEEDEILEGLKINWEHTEYKWIKPEEITNYPTVPKLEKAWKRVWLTQPVEAGLNRLKEDHFSGARELALEGLRVLRAFFDEHYWRGFGSDDIWEEILVVGWHIAKNGRPAMSAAIESTIISTLGDIHRIYFERKRPSDPAPVGEFALAAGVIIDSHIQQESNTLNSLCDHFAEYFANEGYKYLDRKTNVGNDEPCRRLHILTLSNSSTLFHCLFRILSNLDLPVTVRLTVLESRPLYEGVSLATKLLQHLPKSSRLDELEIVPDASMAVHIRSATHVLIGADKIYCDGHVWNKTGSLAAALLANSFDIPLLVVSQISKIITKDINEGVAGEENDPGEMTAAWGDEARKILEGNNERVRVRNSYFELIQSELVDGYITEKGVINAEYIKTVGDKRKSLEKLLFGWL